MAVWLVGSARQAGVLEGQYRYGTAFGGDKVEDFCQACAVRV